MKQAMGMENMNAGATAALGLLGVGGAMMPPSPPPMQFQAGFDNSALMQDPKI